MKFGTELYNKNDYEAIKVLKDFLPDKIFDAHAHVVDCNFVPALRGNYDNNIATSEDYKNFISELLGSPKELRMNLISFPSREMRDETNGMLKASDDFLLNELSKDSKNVGEIIVLANESYEHLEKRIAHPGIKGFKCYHVYSDREDTFNANIGEYLPESAWEIANERKMCITLHMVKDKALADEENVKYICEMAKKYKDATLILAHAARSFAAWTAIENAEKIAHLENVWFDFSAVCESPAMFQIMRKSGVERCMWGSDFPVCADRGKAISFADTFYWIYQKDIDAFSSKTTLNNWLIGTENLMATRQACILAELSESQIEDLFYNNAARLFG